MRIDISLLGDEPINNFKDYITAAFSPNYILNDPDYLSWQYDGGNVYVAKIGDQIVGHFGFRDFFYKVGENTKPFRVLMNLFVLEPYRVMGVGALLAQKVFDTPADIVVSGYTAVASKLFHRLHPKWHEMGDMSRYFCVFDGNHKLLSEFSIPKIIAGKFLLPPAENKVFSMEELSELWHKIKDRYQVSIERTKEYLNWRFINHPSLKYSFLVARRKGIVSGYLVFRFEENDAFKIGRIIDLVSTKEAECELLNLFVGSCKKAGATAADFMFSGKEYGESLEQAGFFNVAGTDFDRFPILFSPISRKKFNINIAGTMNIGLDQCYFTKADGDQDRPNLY